MTTIKIPIGTPLQTIQFDTNSITVGQEATASSMDSKPCKVSGIIRVKGGWAITLQEYRFTATEAGKKIGMGHQDWAIDWDTPTGTHTFKTDLQGNIRDQGLGRRFTIGSARVYRCWEF